MSYEAHNTQVLTATCHTAGGLVFKAHRLSCHSTLSSRAIKKKKSHRLRPSDHVAFQGPSSTVLAALVEQLLRRIVKRFRGGLVFKAHRLSCHSTLGSRGIRKKKQHRLYELQIMSPFQGTSSTVSAVALVDYRGTSLIRKRPPPSGTPQGP